MRIPSVAAIALVLALGACGGGDDEPAEKTSVADAATKTLNDAIASQQKQQAAAKAQLVPKGTPVPQAVSSFQCAKGDDGDWQASAVLANDTKKPQSYQMTVHVGPADGEQTTARTKRVGTIKPDGSLTVQLTNIPAQGDGPCQVQVLMDPVDRGGAR